MAERRMFSKAIIDSDAFLDMPQSTQLLYFHLSMRADDDGFINNPKSIMRNVKCSEDDLKVLIAKRFILIFETGIIVIKHWRIHNYIQKDRYHETKYLEEKKQLGVEENGAYTECIQDVYKMDTQSRLGKVSQGKVSQDDNTNNKEPKHKYGEFQHVLLADSEKSKLLAEWGEAKFNHMIKVLDEGIEAKGYVYKSHYMAIKNWEKNERQYWGNSSFVEKKINSEYML